MEQDEFRDPDSLEAVQSGRLSPQAKEEIYRSYLTGTTIKDMSLKYGIMPQRVKAVVYQKHLYWEEVYPRLGETHMRLAMEMEMLYARDFPFVDYGIDLEVMAALEKGMRISRLTNVPNDTALKHSDVQRIPATLKEDTERALQNTRPRQYDKIPFKFWGKGPGGYLLYDWVHHRGRGSPNLSQHARDLIRYTGTEKGESLVKNNMVRRMKVGGPRYAMMGQSKRRDGHSN